MKSFWMCFVPLFVAVDAVGLLPFFLQLTEGMEAAKVRRVILQSMSTALIVALIFLAVGTAIFDLLKISVADFMVAGGTLLFALSIRDLLAAEKKDVAADPESVGAVPIGVPFITGPAVLTTSLVLVREYSTLVTALAIGANILIAGVVFSLAPAIHALLGKTGSKVISKITSLLLAAIAVMFVRRGLALFLAEGIRF
ncbi:MAG TPA: MarC family protein [Syntrophales bacterium]|nr:MarC family protein [Syntrophales bacterium]HOL58602.1 MarC family protein [Syntrophales bacterium]HPO34790.1 MarC family protein [Syntrophales bacterium]